MRGSIYPYISISPTTAWNVTRWDVSNDVTRLFCIFYFISVIVVGRTWPSRGRPRLVPPQEGQSHVEYYGQSRYRVTRLADGQPFECVSTANTWTINIDRRRICIIDILNKNILLLLLLLRSRRTPPSAVTFW